MSTVAEAVKAAPPIGAAGLQLAGYPLSDWMLVLTAVYTVLLITHKSLELFRAMRQNRPCKQGCHAHRHKEDAP